MTEEEKREVYRGITSLWSRIKAGDTRAMMSWDFCQLIDRITSGDPKTDDFWAEIVPEAERIALKYKDAPGVSRWVQGILWVSDTVATDRDRKDGDNANSVV